jgi:hypothetical protein
MNCVTDNDDEITFSAWDSPISENSIITESQVDKWLNEAEVWRSSGTFESQCSSSQFEEWRHQISQTVE